MSEMNEGDMGENKLRSVLEYCMLHGSNTIGVPKTKLLKLVYLADFSSYYFTGSSLSGTVYKNRAYGPVPDALFALIDEMIDLGDIKITSGNSARFHSLSVEPSYSNYLSGDEIDLLNRICSYWRSKPTEEIVAFTHMQRPWALTFPSEIIPYELIIQEDHPYLPTH